MGWMAAAAIGGSLLDVWGNSTAQHKANRTNIKLQREQQAWEEGMANSAIQRRASDIEKAGGNRALAFTNGSEATTPNISPARVEPAYRGNLGSAALTAATIKQVQAQTENTEAQTKATKVGIIKQLEGSPYWGDLAKTGRDQAEATLLETTGRIGNQNALNKLMEVDYDLKELDLKTQEQLAPLKVEAQRLLNAATKEGIALTKASIQNMLWETYGKKLDSAEKRAAWKFWEEVPASKFIQILRQLAGK